MPDINPSLPVIGQSDSTEEPKVVTALTQLIAAVNDVDSAQIEDGTIQIADLLLGEVLKSGAVVTALPGSPVNGQECYYLADSTNGVVWHLKYRTASGSSYKWEYVGGPPLYAEVTGADTSPASGTAYANPSIGSGANGPSLALPLAGDFMVSIGMDWVSNASVWSTMYMSYDIGGTGAVDADSVRASNTSVGFERIAGTSHGERRKTGLTAVTLTAKYRTTTATANMTLDRRWMRVTPIRVG